MDPGRLTTQEFGSLRRCIIALSRIVREYDNEQSARAGRAKTSHRRARSTSRIKSDLLANQKYTKLTIEEMVVAGLITRHEETSFNYYDPTPLGKEFLKTNEPLLGDLTEAFRVLRRSQARKD